MVDIVGLRKINLGHGHKVGDERVLGQMTGRLRATVRGNDPIGRLGGDEDRGAAGRRDRSWTIRPC